MIKIQGYKWESDRDKTVRYEVCMFPASRDTDIFTNSFVFAWLICKWRKRNSLCEVRIVDTKTAMHYVF